MLTIAFAFLIQAAPQRADTTRADSLRAQRLESVQVTAIRGGTAPIAQTTLARDDIQRRYAGQETPILLQAAPGVTAYSESGSASNYSYMRIRGIDQTRINITLDGIPLNEPEDQGLFFSNFPDFANSIASVQVQRGVGSSTHGVASYAGSVNFESVPIAGVSRGGEVQLTAGSYGTTRASAVLQSGLLPSGFAAYVRGAAQRTNGYRFNSGNESRSVFASGGWFGARDVVKISLLAGLSANQQAYLASPLSTLRALPRDNPYGNDDSTAVADRFHQDLLSIAWTRALSPSAHLAMTAYGFDAGGWYDVPSTGSSDAYHYNLGSRWGGITGALDWSGASSSASVGMNVGRYRRGHWLQQRPDLDTRFYENAGYKGEQSAFVKGSVVRGIVTLFGDVQARFVQFRYEPSAGSGVAPARTAWSFVNPKVGVRASLASGLTSFATLGMNGREPTRADMFAGADDVDSLSAPSVLPLSRVRPETVYDFESGVSFERGQLSAQANVFLMRFRDEIAPTGEINAIGYLLRKNVERSVRRGVETDVTWRASSRVTASGTVSVTESRIDEYRDDASGIVYRGVTALLTPKLVSNHGVRTELTPWLSLDVDGRYTSRMMLTNTDDPRFVVPANWYADLGATFRAARHSVLVQVRNVFDQRVYTGGYPGTDFTSSNSAAMEPYFYTMAGRNVSVNARFAF